MRSKVLFSLIFGIVFLALLSSVQAATITANVTETNINSTVLLTGAGFSPTTTYYLIPLLENKTAWWDGYNENWFFSTQLTNNTIYVTTDGGGGFTYNLYIPNDWRVSGGKVSFKVGEQVASSLLWSTQGTNWLATQPTKNGVTGDSNSDGFVYTASTSAAANQGGVEKFYKSNGALACKYNWTAAVTANDITNNGSIAYVVTSATSNNLQRINMADCTLNGQQTTDNVASYSVNVAPDNSYIIITYAASNEPRKYMINAGTPTQNATFAPTAVASIGYDSCISPDGAIVYIGYASGNVTALNANTGALIWDRSIPKEELGNAGYAFPVYGLSCDNEKVYIARGSVAYPAGITEQGFVEALYAANGSRAWINSKTDTIYDGMDLGNIRCDSSYCYAVKMITPAPYAGVVGSAIVQLNKTTGNVTWWNWRSYLPTAYNGAYGSGGVHSSAQTLWVDSDTNGYIYPVYTNGWIQKIVKNDVNTEVIETNLWIRGLTNFWNYVADVPKNIWLSNETPYYNFRHWNQQGMPLNTSATNLLGTFFRYSMLTTFNSFTAYEYTVASVLGNSIFIDPVIQTAPTQRNEVQYFNGAYHASCPNTRYSPGLYGWHYQDRACHYEEIPATLAGYNIGTTINGTFITAVVYSLIKTKFWEDYPITKYYGNDKWAWASWYNQTNNQQLGFTTKFGNDQEDVYSDIYGRAVLFTNYATTYYYRPQFRADLNRKTDTYILFKPQGGTFNGTNYLWGNVDMETQKIANPINLTLSIEESGTFSISGNNYGNRINFTAQEPNLFNRNDEPAEIIFNASGGIRSDCQDVIITDETDTPISLWQVDNFTSCSIANNVSVWIMMNWTQNEVKNLRLYYNSPSATPSASGTTDLVVTTASGGCATNNHEVNVVSSNWYNWTRPAAATAANEITKFMFNNTANMWASATHYQVAQCYKNSNATGTGIGAAADTCGTAAAPVSRCLQAGGTGKIFAKLNATVAVGAVTGRPSVANTLNVEYYFFANTGRVRIRTQLAEARPIMNTTVSKNWPPYYYFSINSLIPPSGTNSWLYYSGLYEQMKKPVAVFNADMTEANLSSSPLPLMFTIKYGGFNNISQANGSILRPSTVDGTNDFWDKGCTAHKEWQYYAYSGGNSYGTSTAPLYTSEFISCDKSLQSQLPAMGQSGYVNVIPEMAWDGTSVNRWFDPTLIGKFYMMPNTYRPYNRENRYLAPYAITNPYATARISSYIIPVCPTKEYGYKGYDDFLQDLPNLIADTSIHIRENTVNIPCAAQIIRRTDSRGSDGTQIIFAKNLSVIVGETISAGVTYPYNTFSPGTYAYKADGDLDLTFAQKGTSTIVTTGYYGKYYFTYTPENYVIDAFATSGNPQFMTIPATAASYSQRYSWAPESYYNKNVFDETSLWDKTSQNFSYYRNPCWLGRYNNIYGSTQNGHAFLATMSTPGWQHPLWGAGYTCARNGYNMETPDVFRPGWSSIYPTAAGAAAWNEMMIDGRENFAGTGNPTEAGADTYYINRHNSLFDYKHSDDFTSVLGDTSELNQNEKHPNKQPWYCQISRHTNRSFCIMTNSLSSLVYNYNPGGGLTATTPWSAYWSSTEELSSFRNYFVPRFFDTSAWLFPYDHSLEVNMYPTLAETEVMRQNLLYASSDADDYSKFFQKQFPTAALSLQQSQFLLKDWKNSAFIVFSTDTRNYAAGLPMSISGIAISNGEILNDSNITLGIYSENNVLVQEIETQTNSSGMFNWTLTLPSSMSAGLYYVQFNYNDTIVDTAEFRTIGLIATTTSDEAAYEQGQEVQTTITITNSYTSANTDPDQLELRYLNPSSSVVECAKYPNESIVSGCDNNLTKTATGVFAYTFSIGSNPLGVYTQRATVTEDGIAADFDRGFVVALIDPCKPNTAFDYALSYPMQYNNITDILTIIGNSSMGTSNNPITTEQMYEFTQATRGTCIIEKPATGTYTIKSQLVIGNGTNEVYVLSKGESVGFTTQNMPQLFINKSAHINFGGIADGIPQEGSSVKFTSNQTNDILLDVAGGELAFYDSYVGDVGNYLGRFIYRGSCGVLDEETSNVNSSITIKKTIFDRAARGQFFYTENVTIDDMKLNRINSSSISGYGIVSGCSLPALNNLQIYHQEQQGAGIFIMNNTPANTDLVVTSSTLDYNNKDVIANKEGRGVQLVNTQWDRSYGFNWSGDWEGTTTIKESYGYNPTFVDTSSSPIANLTMVLINQYGEVEISQETGSSGGIGEQYIPTWQVEKTISEESESSFNPYTLYAKKYTKTFISEPKSFASRTLETKQVSTNSFTILSEAVASAVKNITYNAPTKISYGDEANSSWTTSGQLAHYPVDQCQYFALFANGTKLALTSNYTIDYETGEITFVQNMAGMEIKPVYFYGGDIAITNGFTLTGAYSMSKIYDYMSYVTSKNNLSEDLITIDGINYQFCVNFVIGNDTHRGSVSDSSATISFKDGYDMSFSGLGGYVDLAGITSGGGSSGGLPLNIFNSVGSSYAPGNTVYIFSTVLNSNGQLVDASVDLSVYLPNGTLYNSSSMTATSTGRLDYNFVLPGDAQLGTWRINIDASYGTAEVHDNVAFLVSTSAGGGGGGGTTPSIQIDAPSIINTNENFGVYAFTRNNNSLLVNCDSGASLTLKDTANGTNILNGVAMTNSGTGRYNYTASLLYQSTFLAEVTCAIGGTTYVSNPKIISSQNVPTNNTGGTGGSAYPTIELLASTPIKTSTTAGIGALVKTSSGIVANCDGSLGITIRNLADGTSSSGEMTNFGTGMYNYSWTTPATASVFYINTSCQISGTSYTGFAMLSTQDVGATATIDYNQIALYVWNYTSRNLTWYNQSVSESIQSCLKDGECSGWWINTTFANIQNTINIINSTANQIKTNTETILSYLNCTSANEICTRLQNILNNATDIQSRVYSLNTSQIPSLQTGVDNVYTDTQYIRTNMATAAALQDVNSSIWWIRNNLVTQAMFEGNMTDIKNRLNEINTTTQEISTIVDCSNPANSPLCTYLNNINSTITSIYSEMATYSQVSGLQSNVTWIRENMITQEMFNANMSEIRNRLTEMNTTIENTYNYLSTTITNNLNYINQTTLIIREEANANNLSIQSKLDVLQNNVTWLIENVATSSAMNANFSNIMNRLNEINSTTQWINNIVNCSNPANSVLCSYLGSINTTTNSIYSEMATQSLLQQVALNVSYIRDNMATYSQVADVGANVSWIKDNVATQEQINNNFTDVINRLTNMNSTLYEVHDDLNAVNSSLSNQIVDVQSNITWLIDNVATQEQINNNFTEVFTRLNSINTTIAGTNNYLYGTITNSLSEINSTNNEIKDYLYNQITDSLNQINNTTQDSYSYLINNLSIATNLTEVLAKLDGLNENLTYVKNNMFYQGNATGAFLVDYLATVYAEKNSRAELWVLTRDLLGNSKTVSSATCSIVQKGIYIANATVSINSGSVYAYWDIPSNQTNGEYSWNCTLTGSTLSLYVPFFVSSTINQFAITSLSSASPKYPNENAIVEATFASQNGSVEPDSINLTIYKPNYLTIWYSANKNDFSVRNGVWYWTQMIESSPTTGTYYVNMKSTYDGYEDSRTTQFRIATGGPYKVYLECPTSSNVGSNLVCTLIIQDEGEAATESTTTIWVDTNNNGILDAGEPQTSFSKETQPMQNITETATINVPSSHAIGSFVVRASTEYLNSGQPNSAASDSVTLQTSSSGGDTGGGTGGGSGGGSSGASQFNADFTKSDKFTFSVEQGTSKTFTFNGVVSHTIKVESVSESKAIFVIRSEPITITVNVGETKGVDINKDGFLDIKINLKKINNGIVDYSIEKVQEGASRITGNTIIYPEHLMDVEVIILDDYKTVVPGSKILAKVILYNLGIEEIKDAFITYCIRNAEEEEKCLKETIAIYTKIELVKEFLVSKDMPAGRYYLDVTSLYGNETANSRASFLVESDYKKETSQVAGFFNIKINKSYLIIGLLSLASLIILIFIVIIIIKKKNRHQKISGIEYKLHHLKELKSRGEISEKTYHTERERLLQRISGILKGKTMSVVLFGIGLISLLGTLNIGRGITGHVIGESVQNNLATKYIYFILLIGAFGLLIFIHNKKIKQGVEKVNEKIKKKYPANSIKGLIGKKVYSESGDYVGQIKDIILGENKIDSLKIKLDKKHKFKVKGIVIKWKQIVSCGEIIIIDSGVLNTIG